MRVSLQQLRQTLRRQRRKVNRFQQRQAEQRVWQQLIRLPEFHQAKNVGVYLDAFGEIATQRIIRSCFQQKKNVYLPMICSMNQHLVWVRINANQYQNRRFSHHPLGMREPMATRGHQVKTLDILLMPLLACDMQGTRIGMGGGYYDRTLSRAPRQPFRLGLAHEFQRIVFPLPREAWDQPVDALLTPKNCYRFKR